MGRESEWVFPKTCGSCLELSKELNTLRSRIVELEAKLADCNRIRAAEKEILIKEIEKTAKLEAKLTLLIETLGWYKEKAQSASRYLSDKNKSEALLALLTELALDNGSRADTATKEMPHA